MEKKDIIAHDVNNDDLKFIINDFTLTTPFEILVNSLEKILE